MSQQFFLSSQSDGFEDDSMDTGMSNSSRRISSTRQRRPPKRSASAVATVPSKPSVLGYVTPVEYHQQCSLNNAPPHDAIERSYTDKKRREMLESIVLADPVEHFSLVQSPNDSSSPQYVGMGYIKATLSGASFGQLQDIVAYLLKHNLVQNPSNYDYYDMLKTTGGGRDILLNELFKEPNDTLVKAYLILGRLRPAEEHVKYSSSLQKQKKMRKTMGLTVPGIDDDDSPGGNLPDTDMLKTGSFSNQDIPLVIPAVPTDSKLTTTWYTSVPTDTAGVMQANIGGPYNDERVYVKFPVRSINDKKDSESGKVVDLCGEEMDNWMKRTSHEVKRDFETFDRFEDMRTELAERKRAVCPATPASVQYGIDMLRQGQDITNPIPFTENDIAALRTLGWTDDELKRAGYLA